LHQTIARNKVLSSIFLVLTLRHNSFLILKQTFFLMLLVAGIAACQRQTPMPAMGFYYWRTRLALSPKELDALPNSGQVPLYVRFFDVDVPSGDSLPRPIAPVEISSIPKNCTVVPVVFIKNRVFEHTDTFALQRLAYNVFSLLTTIAANKQLAISTVQLDCDWTLGTQQPYFYFLTHLGAISNFTLSATIRLHQVKYRKQTGIPPVSSGMLMFYNMGTINAGPNSSIYEAAIAASYTAAIRHYPLPLNLALPIFGWGIQLRNGRVVQLLNKMNSSHFGTDTNFAKQAGERWVAKHAGFKGGYYFEAGDIIKIEQASPAQLLQMAVQLRKYLQPSQIIFYDLDSINLQYYDQTIFKKVLAEFR
jgi:hypothetical protein